MDPTRRPLHRALAIQQRVIRALLVRELITRYGRHNIGFLWLFVEPMIFTLFVTALWSLTRTGFRLPIVEFAVTGYSAVLLWRNMPARCIGGVGPNVGLLYHRNVRPLDIYAARLVLEAVGATISFVVLALVFMAIEWMRPPENVLQVVFAWLLLMGFGSALALLLGGLSQQTELVTKIWAPFSYIMFPLSGVFFMVEWLPPAAREVVLLFPMVHCTEMLREGWFGSTVSAIYSTGYVIIVSAALLLLGLAQERRVTRGLVVTV